MSDPHRGAYTPNSDAPLSFDARQPVRGRGGGGQAPVTLLLSFAILIVLVVGIFFVYRGGVRGANDAPQPVGTPVGSIKDAAPGQTDKADPASGLQIYKTEGAEVVEAPPTFAPPPETPQPRPVPQVIRTPIPAATQTPAAAPTTSQPNPAPLPVVVGKTPAPTAAAAPPPVAKTTPPPATATRVAATATGGAAVQIGAFSSQALADSGYAEATRIAPGLAAGKGKSVQAIQSNGQTLYRTAFTGFESREAATTFCSALKAAGKSCFVR